MKLQAGSCRLGHKMEEKENNQRMPGGYERGPETLLKLKFSHGILSSNTT